MLVLLPLVTRWGLCLEEAGSPRKKERVQRKDAKPRLFRAKMLALPPLCWGRCLRKAGHSLMTQCSLRVKMPNQAY